MAFTDTALSLVDDASADPLSAESSIAERDLIAVLNALPAMVGYWDRYLRNAMANDAYVEYFGLTPSEIRGMHIADLFGPELFAKNEPYVRGALAGEPQRFERTFVDAAGTSRSLLASYIPDLDDDGTVRGFSVLVNDITALKQAEAAKLAAQAHFRGLFNASPIGAFIVSEDGVFVDANPAAEKVFRRSRESLLGVRPADVVHPDDRAIGAERLKRVIAGEISSYSVEKRYIRGDGTTVWAQLDVTRLDPAAGEPLRVVGQLQDISERREQMERLKRLASQDPLTGVLNRHGLSAALARALDRVAEGTAHALVVLDLDAFKPVNDALGHDAGDAVLVAVAKLLQAKVGDQDVVGRLGGDEFAVVLANRSTEEAEEMRLELQRAVDEARLGLASSPVGASLGVAPLTSCMTATEALRLADVAMYRDKARRRAQR